MNADDFEKHLQRQPTRLTPPAWRTEILSAARAASSRPSTLDPRAAGWLSTLNSQPSTLLWPHPKAWAGLAAVWLVVLALNFAARDTTPGLETRLVRALTIETVRSLKQREQLLAEVSAPLEFRESDRPKAIPPRPRTERRYELLRA